MWALSSADVDVDVDVDVVRERESLAQATAWFAPLPPGETAKALDVIVSPGSG